MAAPLTAAEERLVELVSSVARGDWQGLRELRRNAPPGEPDVRWREALLQSHLFLGFPRIVEAFEVLTLDGTLHAPTPEEHEPGDQDFQAKGAPIFDGIYQDQARLCVDGWPNTTPTSRTGLRNTPTAGFSRARGSHRPCGSCWRSCAYCTRTWSVNSPAIRAGRFIWVLPQSKCWLFLNSPNPTWIPTTCRGWRMWFASSLRPGRESAGVDTTTAPTNVAVRGGCLFGNVSGDSSESPLGEPTRYGISGPAPPGACVPSLMGPRLLT